MSHIKSFSSRFIAGLRVREKKEVYEGEVTELTPVENENATGGYGKVSPWTYH